MDISPVAASLSQSQSSTDVSTSVAKKTNDVAKKEGEQLTAMIQSANPEAGNSANGNGGMIDVNA